MALPIDPTFLPWLLASGVVIVTLLIFGITALTYAIKLSKRLAEERQSGEEARLTASSLHATLVGREQSIAELERRASALEKSLMEASQARAGLEAELAAAEKSRKEQAELLLKSEIRLREAFTALSTEALGKNNEMFLSLAKAQLGEFNKGAAAELEERRAAVDRLVKPIGETLGKMGAALEAAEKVRSVDHGQSIAIQQNLAVETNRLTRALHHSSARGHWGELQLRRVVEMAGMLEHCDFEEQVTMTGADGARLRPDMVVHLAGGRTIVVDAKAPMENYLKSQEAENRHLEQEYLAKHAREVRARINELGTKGYWNCFDDAPEFVVMFFPSESVFADALRFDADLIDFGSNNNVIPASPVTLIALLRAAAHGWRQEKANENAKRIFELGCELHERFAKEYQHLATLGVTLGKAVESFNKGVGSAERMLFPTLKKFTALLGSELFPAPLEIEAMPRIIDVESVAAETDSDENIQSAAQ